MVLGLFGLLSLLRFLGLMLASTSAHTQSLPRVPAIGILVLDACFLTKTQVLLVPSRFELLNRGDHHAFFVTELHLDLHILMSIVTRRLEEPRSAAPVRAAASCQLNVAESQLGDDLLDNGMVASCRDSEELPLTTFGVGLGVALFASYAQSMTSEKEPAKTSHFSAKPQAWSKGPMRLRGASKHCTKD